MKKDVFAIFGVATNSKKSERGVNFIMETFLAFSGFNSLLNYLNVILVGAIVFWAINRFSYFVDVIIYAIAKTFIPIITSLILGSILGTHISFGIGTILILLIVYFIIGLAVIAITEKVYNYFDSDTIIYFVIVFGIIDLVISWLCALIIGWIF